MVTLCRRLVVVGLAMMLLSAATARAEEGAEAEQGIRERIAANLSINGYLRNETAFRLNRPASLVKDRKSVV